MFRTFGKVVQYFGARRLQSMPKFFKHQSKNDPKSSPKANKIDVWAGLGGLLGRLGGAWGRLVGVMGVFWGVLKASWAALGPPWGRLGAVLGRFVGRLGDV